MTANCPAQGKETDVMDQKHINSGLSWGLQYLAVFTKQADEAKMESNKDRRGIGVACDMDWVCVCDSVYVSVCDSECKTQNHQRCDRKPLAGEGWQDRGGGPVLEHRGSRGVSRDEGRRLLVSSTTQ